MEQRITVEDPGQLTLSEEVQEKIVKFIGDNRDKAKRAREPYKTGDQGWEETNRLYNCTPKPLEGDDVDWQSNHVLPWAYDAVESAYSHLASTMLPRDEQIFDATGRTQEDHPGVKVMAQYLEHRLSDAGTLQQLKKGLHQALRKNHTCYKTYWRKDMRIGHEIVVDELTGQKKRQPKEHVVFNNVWTDVVDIDDFWFYPIHGRLENTTHGHTTYRFKEDLTAEKERGVPYINLEKIKSKEDSTDPEADKSKKTYQGLKIEEVWVPRIEIEGKIYQNYVATVVNEKILIRFQPNPYDMGKSPFTWFCVNPDGPDCLLGYGLLSRGNGLLNYASFLLNQRGNEIKTNLYGPHKYYDDGVFNPYNVISRPGAMIRMASLESVQANLQPLSVNPIMLAEGMQEIMNLKAEYESVTVPKVVKGMLEVTNRTATEIQGAQNNGSTKLHVLASSFNDEVLKPKLELDYLMIYQMIQINPGEILPDIARLTQESTTEITETPDGQPLPEPITVQRTEEEMIADLPDILPLPEIDIKIVGYENMIRKQEKLQAISQALPQLAQSPAAQYLKWYNIGEDVLRLLDLDYDNLLMDSEEAKQADAQAAQQADHQQQLMIMQEKAKLDLESAAQQHKMRMDEADREIKLIELQLKFQQEANRSVEAEVMRDLKITESFNKENEPDVSTQQDPGS